MSSLIAIIETSTSTQIMWFTNQFKQIQYWHESMWKFVLYWIEKFRQSNYEKISFRRVFGHYLVSETIFTLENIFNLEIFTKCKFCVRERIVQVFLRQFGILLRAETSNYLFHLSRVCRAIKVINFSAQKLKKRNRPNLIIFVADDLDVASEYVLWDTRMKIMQKGANLK